MKEGFYKVELNKTAWEVCAVMCTVNCINCELLCVSGTSQVSQPHTCRLRGLRSGIAIHCFVKRGNTKLQCCPRSARLWTRRWPARTALC